MVPYGTLWYLMVPRGTLWYHKVPYGTIWYHKVILKLTTLWKGGLDTLENLTTFGWI